MKHKLYILFVVLFLVCQLVLAACTPEVPAVPTPTAMAEPIQASTPTPTPTLAPIPTTVPHPLSISPDNADQIIQLGQWGKGYPSKVIWSPDGTKLAVATSVGTYLLNGDTFEEYLFIKSETKVTSLDFSPDGTMLALSGCQYYDLNLVCSSAWVKVVDTKTGNKIQVFYPGSRDHPFLKFSPNGKQLIAAGCNKESGPGIHCREGKISIWDITTGETVHELVGHGGWVNNIAFHPNGILMASSSGGNWSVKNPASVIIWNMLTGKQILTVTVEYPAGFNFIMFDQSGEFLLTGSSELQLNVYNTRNGDVVDTTRVTDEEKMAELFSKYLPMNAILLMEEDDTFQIWDEAGTLHSRVSIPENIWRWAISPDLSQLASATTSEFVVTENENIVFQKYWQNAAIEASGNLPDGRWVLAGSRRNDTTCLFDPLTGELIQTFPIQPDRDEMAISPNGQMIAISKYSNEQGNEGLFLFDITSGKELFSNPSPIYSLAFSPDSQYLVTGGDGGKLQLWHISDPQNAFSTSLEGHKGVDSEGWSVGVDVVAFTPDGKYLFSGDWDSIIHIWEVPSGQLISTIHDSFAQFFMLSPDGNTLVYKDNQNINRLFFMDIVPIIGPTPAEIQAPYVLENHSFKSGFAYHPDGQIFAYGESSSYSQPASIYLWDTKNHTSLTRLEGHTEWVRFLAFSPDRRYLVSNGFDGTTRIWGLPD
jgi:WD40 repeat protein